MKKLKEVARLFLDLKLGARPIARACSISASTAYIYVDRLKERFGLLADKEKTYQQNMQLTILMRHAHFRHPNARFDDIEFRTRKGITKDLFLKLCQNEWIRSRNNLILIGPTGVGNYAK